MIALVRSLASHFRAHGSLSALSDRIKMARGAKGAEIGLSVQHVLNCGGHLAGTCHGGTASGTYHFVKKGGGVAFDTCQQYLACSSNSKEGFCPDIDTTCSPLNTCRTCSGFGEACAAIGSYPNATIAEYGIVHGEANIMAEIFARGPVACGVNAEPLLDYTKGVLDDNDKRDKLTNHIISIVGWGVDAGTPYWSVRNSWGTYWGEMGYFRLKRGENQLGIERSCSWATPAAWTEVNKACGIEGAGCEPTTAFATDPSNDLAAFRRARGLPAL